MMREFANLQKKGSKRRTEADNLRMEELRAILKVPKSTAIRLPKPEAIKADLRKVLGNLQELTTQLKTTNLPDSAKPLQEGEVRVAPFVGESTGVSLHKEPTAIPAALPTVESHMVYVPPERSRLVHLLSWAGMQLNLFVKPMYEAHPHATVREKFHSTMTELEQIVANETRS